MTPWKCPVCEQRMPETSPPGPPLAEVKLGEVWQMTKDFLTFAWFIVVFLGIGGAFVYAFGWAARSSADAALGSTWWSDLPAWARASVGVGLAVLFVASEYCAEFFTNFGAMVSKMGLWLGRSSRTVRVLGLTTFLLLFVLPFWAWFAAWNLILVPAVVAVQQWRQRRHEATADEPVGLPKSPRRQRAGS